MQNTESEKQASGTRLHLVSFISYFHYYSLPKPTKVTVDEIFNKKQKE